MKNIFQISLSLLLIFFLIQVIPFNLLTLEDVSASSNWTVISDKDFNNGTSDNVTIVGNGESAELKLKSCKWLRKFPIGEPNARLDHSMASIYNDDKVLLFGGLIYGWISMNDTWVYDFSNNTWTEKTPNISPKARYDLAMSGVYGTDNVVLFGGMNGIYLNDTWIYNLSTNKWIDKTSSGNKPQGRDGHAMASIYGTNKVLLFGGFNGSNLLSDTWIYDLSNNTWTRKNLLNHPSNRRWHKMSSIYGTDKVILFGGSDDKTWIYDLSDDNWTKKITSNKVEARIYHAMESIWGTDKVLLFGGRSSSEKMSDTWIYDLSDNTWTKKVLQNYPNPRDRHTIASIIRTNKVILFGGFSWKGGSNTYSNDTWEFRYIDQGIFISDPYNINTNSSLKTISWISNSINETSIKLQIRTSVTESELNSKAFIGPDGKTSSFYISPGTSIFFENTKDRWIQYMVYFNTTIEDELPSLNEITVTYNCWPKCPSLISPSDEFNLTNNKPTFSWNFIDLDSTHQTAFELQISNDKSFVNINYTSGKQNSTLPQWQFPAGTDYIFLPDGLWYWKVRTKDNDGNWGPFGNPSKFVIDSKAPSSTINIPTNNGFYKTLNSISGKAFDSIGSGMQKVEIMVQRLNDFYYWNGTGWDFNAHWLSVNGKNSWTFNSSNINWTTDTQYNIHSKATDNTNNLEIPGFGNTFMIDNKPPSPISISINNDREFTNSTSINLSLSAEDSGSGIDQMAFSINGTSWTDWEPFNHKRSISLSPNDGEKIVYFKVRDRTNNIAIDNTTIILDTQPPENLKVLINNGAKYTNSRLIDLNLSATDSLSGVKDMALDTKKSMIISWEPFKETKSMILPLGDGEKNIYFWVRDYAGNFAITNTTIILDTVPPHSLSIKINNGSLETNSITVYLNINAIDDTSGVYQMSFSNEGITWSSWEVFRNNKSYDLLSGDGIKTIYFKVKDYADNIADPESATILLNTTKPDNDKSQPSMFYSTIEYWLFLIIVIIIIFILIVIQYIIKRKKHSKPEDKLPSVEVSTVKPGLHIGQEPINEVRISSPSYIQPMQTSEAATTVPSESSIETSPETIIPKSTQIAQTTSSQQISQPTTLPQLPPAQQQNTSSETQESSVEPMQESSTQIPQSPTIAQPETSTESVNEKSQPSD